MNYSYKVPCAKERLKDIREFVAEALGNHGLSEVQINTLVLAIDEVCANLIIHAHHCNPKETIEVDILVDGHEITFDIIDKGNGFDINQYKKTNLEEIIREKKKGGIGLILVKKIMDDIESEGAETTVTISAPSEDLEHYYRILED